MKRDYGNHSADLAYRRLLGNFGLLPCAFTYRGKEHFGIIPDRAPVTKKEKGREITLARQTFDESMTVTLLLTYFPSHGATEWRLYFENPSKENSGILENVRTSVEFVGEEPVLRGILGDHVNNYRPYRYDLSEGNVSFDSNSGRATHVNFPYFDLSCGDGGVMLAIGWGGTWTASFEKTAKGTRYTANAVNGMKTYLKPGETIRGASFLTAPYTVRDEGWAINYWRDWFIKYNMPKADSEGRDMEPFSTCCLSNDTGLPNSDGSISERFDTWKPSLEKMIAEDCKVDFRWFDAGWYQTPDLKSAEPYVRGRDWWDTVGTWKLDPVKWPDGSFRESTDYAREHGMKTLMWFEPERVTDPGSLVKNFGYRREWAIEREGVGTVSNNIGDEACLKWTLERICGTLRDNRVEMYREDNNCDPASLWRYLDEKEGEGRKGITECRLIGAHYRMWEEIVKCTLSYGGCGFVDSCASGGGRNDLDSMKLGVPLLRSDADRTTTSLRLSMTSSFNRFIPFCGANTKEKKEQLAPTGVSDVYVWRASYLPVLNVDSQFVCDKEQDFGMLRFGLREWDRVKPYLLKEFYPLTPWHDGGDTSGFTAYAYFDPETEKGVLFAFRQETCAEESLSLTLPFVPEGKTAVLTDEDTGEMTEGNAFTLSFASPRTAKLLWFELK